MFGVEGPEFRKGPEALKIAFHPEAPGPQKAGQAARLLAPHIFPGMFPRHQQEGGEQGRGIAPGLDLGQQLLKAGPALHRAHQHVPPAQGREGGLQGRVEKVGGVIGAVAQKHQGPARHRGNPGREKGSCPGQVGPFF